MKLLGAMVTDRFSGVQYEVIGIGHMATGCKHARVMRHGVNSEGNPYEMMFVDLPQIKDYKSYEVDAPEGVELLGKEVIDTLSGYRGTCTSVTEYADIDNRVSIQGRTISMQTGLPPDLWPADLEFTHEVAKVVNKLREEIKPVSRETKFTGASIHKPVNRSMSR